jgi:hypothetical protein
MKYRLAIADRVGVRVEGAAQDESGAEKPFAFTLVLTRLPNDELRKEIEDQARTVPAFIRANASAWREQTLVLTDGGDPAQFSPEALDALLSIAGMPAAIWRAYLAQVMVTSKN